MATVMAVAMPVRQHVGAHLHGRNAADHAQPDLALPADRLQRNRPVGTAPKDVGAETNANRGISGRADVRAAQTAGARRVRRKHRPHQVGRLVEPEVDAEAANLRVVCLRPAAIRRPEQALQIGDGADDEL